MKTPNINLRWYTLLAVLINVAGSFLINRVEVGPASIEEVSRRHDSLFVPAGYAFSIWALIYASFILYAIIQLLPAQKNKTIYDHLAIPVILINLLGMLWQIVFRFEQMFLSVCIIISMLLIGMVYYLRTQQAIWAQHHSKWLMVPSSVFLGWISVATISNISVWLVSTGWDAGYLSEATWAKLLLGAALLLSGFISIRYRDYLYSAVIAWAAYAIFVAAQNKDGSVAQTAMYTAIVAILLTIIAAARNARIELRHHRKGLS